MKRTFAITLTVAMIGSLMFMGFAGTAAAQNVDNGIDIGDIGADFGDQTQGDATNNIDVNQENNNAQTGVSEATSGDAVAVSDGGAGGGAAAADDPKHDPKKDDPQPLANGADSGNALAGSLAASQVTQVQDVNQQNAADIDATAQTGDNVQDFDVGIDIGDDTETVEG
ncbi:hypothetical protein G6M89_08850 [Natronolimnobius sp. AArcel1]|uniref:hypothetical protein n=1 Tax=Natronolimnobius sp. AArcel1 TaxID=1679093 RepID=UPI0013ECD6E2|nr:hypothetical protein [Natronolimnobius sp. AArcel1]NGM69113.1 hypothetical protein [Natronolimnobius sp. AArcel1]